MILYIHGFGGSGLGNKAQVFRGFFKEKNIGFLAPSLSYVPQLAIQTLEEIIELYLSKNEKISLIGSSLGGFYSIYLANKYNLQAVLINPAVYAHVRLKEALGEALNYHDLSHFEWNENHLQMLKNLYSPTIEQQERFLLMVQKGDELLDYSQATNFLPNAKQIIEENGDHSFVNIESKFDSICKFLKLNDLS